MSERPDPPGFFATVLDAVARFDFAEVHRRLAAAAREVDGRRFALDLLPALLTEIGDRWGSGEYCVAQEHGFSQALRTVLGQLLVSTTPPTGRVALFATPAGERHEFGAMGAALLAASSGWRPVYLGPDVPVADLALAAAATGARVVLLSAVALAPEALEDEVAAVRRALPAETALVVGGARAETHRARLAWATPVLTLATFDRVLSEGSDLSSIPSE